MFKLSISTAAILLLAAPAFARDAKCGDPSHDAAMSHDQSTAMFVEKGHDAGSGTPAGGKGVCALDISDLREGDDT